ncbi:MAG: exodeoxyribonuclease VII small subunit [Candidatus Adiutrix sp.]|jgi:exodeoxyribonuclease VII small subunit|nr:exodeoxyribonuclease VII small subunit [Candidatus Adiutrix sp.]
MKKKNESFEEGLSRLEDIFAALEDRSLGLYRALAAVEEGLTLSRSLKTKLDEAAGKIEMLTKDLAGRPQAVPFDPDEDESDDDDDEDEDK